LGLIRENDKLLIKSAHASADSAFPIEGMRIYTEAPTAVIPAQAGIQSGTEITVYFRLASAF
jgi:hypothetical protein